MLSLFTAAPSKLCVVHFIAHHSQILILELDILLTCLLSSKSRLSRDEFGSSCENNLFVAWLGIWSRYFKYVSLSFSYRKACNIRVGFQYKYVFKHTYTKDDALNTYILKLVLVVGVYTSFDLLDVCAGYVCLSHFYVTFSKKNEECTAPRKD